MRVIITGGAGFLGSLLARRLLEQGTLRQQPIESLVLADLVECRDAQLRADARVRCHAGDLLESLPALMAEPVDAVFHLASAVSAECEADFGLGLRSNLDTTRALLDACRSQAEQGGAAPLFFFSSSVAVYGSDPGVPMPDCVEDHTLPTPQSSYGIHKFMCEQLVADYTRKGYIDGRCARLMTVAVRPGRPNGAASSFISGVIREPLEGVDAICPVDPDTAVALSSPANTVAGIIKVAEAPREQFGGRTALNLPALTVTVREMLSALESVAGADVARRVSFKPDAAIARIVGSWPARFTSRRAGDLGLKPDADFVSVIEQFLRGRSAAARR